MQAIAFVLWGIILQAPVVSPAPEIDAAWIVPGQRQVVVVSGRHLWLLAKGDAVAGVPGKSCRLMIDGIESDWEPHHGEMGHDKNQGLGAIQFFRLKAPAPAKATAKLIFERHDEVKAFRDVMVPVNRGRWQIPPAGDVEEVSSPIEVLNGETRDFGGKTYRTAANFRGKELVRFGAGSVIRNGRFFVPEDASGVDVVCRARDPRGLGSMGAHFDAVEVIHAGMGGTGIDLGNARMVFVGHSMVAADIGVQVGNQQANQDSVFWQVRLTSPRDRWGGSAGRMFGGERNLFYRCFFERMGRGPTAWPWSSPNYGSAFFECRVADCGSTQGASEGWLVENYESFQSVGEISRREVVVRGVDARPSDWSNDDTKYFRPGLFVAVPAKKAWARIVSVVGPDGAGKAIVRVDRDLPTGSFDIRVGNAAVRNNWVRCYFARQKAGIFLFGSAYDNLIAGCEFESLVGGVVQLQTDQTSDRWVTSWGLVMDPGQNYWRGVRDPYVVIPNGRDWPKLPLVENTWGN